MTIFDLVKFCEEQNFTEFDSNKCGYQLCVSIPATFEMAEDDKDDSMLFANIRVFHTKLNRNGSNVTKDAMKNSLSSFAYKPILCNFVTSDENEDELDFSGHDMEIDEDGNVTYLEKQVGCITADEPVMKLDKDTGRYYAYAKCAIPREYTPAADIIERRNGTDVSAELYVNKNSYDAKKKELLLEDIELAAVTLLGASHTPGMEKACLQIEDFAVKDNISFEQNDKLIETLNALNKTLEELTINNAEGKEEKPMDMFNELLKKYEVTIEDIQFEYEGLSDEELEAAFKEAFADDDPDGTDGGETDSEPDDDSEASNDSDPETDSNDGNDNNEEDVVVIDDDLPPRRQNNEIQFSAVVNGEIKEFSISLIEKLNALRDLVNNTYSEADDTWYDVDAYDEDKYVIMHDYWRNKHYRQDYTVRNDVYSLKGDRVEVFAQFLTQDEINSLAKMKSNYEQICKDLAQYQKKELVNSKEYSAIAEKEDFIAVVDEINNGMNEMSFEELKTNLDNMLLKFAKNGELNIKAIEENKPENKKFARVGLIPSGAKGNPKKSRYGNIFKR